MMRLFLFVLLFALRPAAAAPVAFWVWHRGDPLREAEIAELRRQEVRTVIWNVGEMEMRDGAWRWKARALDAARLGGPLHVVPVVRLSAETRKPFESAAWAKLGVQLRAVATKDGELQVDFDCPDRLLAAYADALAELRRAIPRLSITALGHWSTQPAFPALQRSVSEITPMFYDMQADPTGVNADAPPPPLLDPAQVERALRSWSACAIPWRAGLPSFARLTVFDRAGMSRGQIPNWAWDDFCFHKSLHALGPTRLGMTIFRTDADTRVARTAVRDGEFIVSRFTDRTALARVAAIAHDAGAAGVTLFRLPDDTDPAGASLSDLGRLATNEKPHLALRWKSAEQLELVNDSPVDLIPRLAGAKDDRDRGYALELDAPAPIFREALAGEFWRVTAHTQPDSPKPQPAPVQIATRLTFWFSHLRAGAALRSGLLQTAPGASIDGIRYRILNAKGTSSWTALIPKRFQDESPINTGLQPGECASECDATASAVLSGSREAVETAGRYTPPPHRAKARCE